MKHEYCLNNILFNQIKWRYHLLKPTSFTRKDRKQTIAESFYPAIQCMRILNGTESNNKPQSIGPAITDRVARDLNISQLHISELTTMLGFTKTEIGKIIQSVKKKRYKMRFIGAGGSVSNFIYWTAKMAEWVGKNDIFSDIRIVENDFMDVTNLFRIPYIPEYKNDIENLNKAELIPLRLLRQLTDKHTIIQEKLDEDNLHHINVQYGIIYGAPDIPTRQLLNDNNIKWFAATHKDNIAKITYRQQVQQDNLIETYGKIYLPVFFINQLNMAINFLIRIGSDNFRFDDLEDDQVIYKCDFDEDLKRFYTQMKAGSKKVFIQKFYQNAEFTEEPGVMP